MVTVTAPRSRVTVPRVPARRLAARLGERSGTGALGGLVVAAFCLVIAGPNLPTALLPTYRETYRMSPFGLSLLFATYLMVLVPALVLCTRPAFRRRAATLMGTGLVAALAADLLMATSHSALTLMAGRALSGISVAVSTGAAAALMVTLVGERGRGAVATGNIAGAVLGTVAAVVLAQMGVGPSIYLVHAVAVLLVLLALGLVLAVRPAGSVGDPASARPITAAQVLPSSGTGLIRRHVILGYAVGAVGWAIPGVITALVPALLRGFIGSSAIVIATSPAILLLVAAWALQSMARRTALRWVRGYELTIGTAMGGLGLALLTAGALTRSLPLVYLGCAVAAGGPALAYRGGMMLLTRGLEPARQGAVTSRYAASSYGMAAVVVVGSGAVGALGGMVTAVAVGAGLLAVLAAALLIVILVTELPRRTR